MKTLSNGEFFMIGPWIPGKTSKEVKIVDELSCILPQEMKTALNELGAKWYFGQWNIPGAPNVLLLDYSSLIEPLDYLKGQLFVKSGIQIPPFHDDLENYLRFGWLIFKLCSKV